MATCTYAIRRSRVTKHGLEVPNGLTYHDWEPGGEYTKPLTFKNVHLKPQRIKFNISGSQFSSVVYSQPLVLSAGTSYTLPITFRPCEKNCYQEHIEFETSQGIIQVPIQAWLPKSDLALPDSLKLGMCAVEESVTVNFEVSNISKVPIQFSWEVPDGFEILPASASLSPKKTCRLTATFRPCLAAVYSASTVCVFSSKLEVGGGPCNDKDNDHVKRKFMKLEGIGKYPHLTVKQCSGKKANSKQGTRTVTDTLAISNLSTCLMKDAEMPVDDLSSGCETVVDFGAVAVGSVIKKKIEITNVSPVVSTFSITSLNFSPSSHEIRSSSTNESIPLFACSMYEGTLQPHASTKVTLFYSPLVLTTFPSIGYFSVKAVGGIGSSVIKCFGQPKGPIVCLDQTVVDFGNVLCGEASTTVMYIKNNSDVPTTFQLQLGKHSIFHCDVHSGRLEANGSQTVTVRFKPHKPIPYCRRVVCLVQHQEPLFAFFIGTGYSETSRPAVLQPRHIKAFLSHAKSGISMLPPEQLKQYIQEGRLIPEGPNRILLPSSSDLDIPPPHALITEHTSNFAHYLLSENEPSAVPHVSIDTEVLKFGYCVPNQLSQSKLVSITNHTQGTLCCSWVTVTSGAFLILPEEREVLSGQTTSFAFHFKPGKPNQFYCKEIECFVYYKSLGDYHHVDADTVCPPWCITVTTSGHTFAHGSETFLPKFNFDSKNLVFPPAIPHQPVFRTVLLNNIGDTPILFDIEQDPSEVFFIKPSHGLLTGKHQLFVVQMLPANAQLYKHIMPCHLNATPIHTQELLLSGSGDVPGIFLENEGQLFFRPTCVGTTSTAKYKLTNTSKLPLSFQWKLKNIESGVLQVRPMNGTIMPNETQSHSWQFTPLETKLYSLKTILHASFQPVAVGHGGGKVMVTSPKKNRNLLHILGSGIMGDIKCSPSVMDCGTVIIGTSQQRTLTLTNPTSSDLHYRLKVQDCIGDELSTNSSCVEVSPSEGVLPAYLTESVRLTLRPSQCEHYTCTLRYELVANNCGVADIEEAVLCTLTMQGAYPTLLITDVQGQGSANLMSKIKLWNMLSIDNINHYLCEEPSSAELRYVIATRHSMRRRVPVRTRAIVDFDFGAATLNSENSTIHLMLENKGDVPTEWAFQFPIDMHLEPEYWAETGQLDEVERHELNVLENELFTVQPKTGQLSPGERTTVTANYKHTSIGMNRLPVLLKINRGREVLLNWNGVTVEVGRPYVHIKQAHYFDPVPIGAHAYPRQVFDIHNSGDTSVGYTVDTRPLEDLQASNYLMPILKCLQPKGEILPGCSVSIEFVFSPLEAKQYAVDLPIHLTSGDTVLVRFSGEGYDPKQLENEAPLCREITSNVPVHGSIAVKEKPAKLSHDSLTFGHLPLFAVVRRIVFITNSSKHTLSYLWELTSDRAKEVMSVQPASGYIQPGMSAACKVTFCSHSSPSGYDLDLICKVTDESELMSYRHRLKRWQLQQEEKKHLFTITQDNLTPSRGSKTAPPSKGGTSTTKLKSLSGKKSKSRPRSSDTELRAKYQTLPPIGTPSEACTYEEWKKMDLSVKTKTRPRATKSSEDEPPLPPEPLILHLGVLAQTFSIPDYASLHNDLDTFFIDQQSLVSESPTITLLPMQVTTEENALVRNVLNQMTRELLNDDNFHAALRRVVEEPVPYFSQFSSRARQPSESVLQSAHRHIYAAGLEDIPVAKVTSHPITPSPSLTPQPSQSQCLMQSEGEGGGEVEGGGLDAESEYHLKEQQESHELMHEEAASDTAVETNLKIKHLHEFGSLVEGIFENTILNILKEANSNEFNITAPMYTIAKPSDID